MHKLSREDAVLRARMLQLDKHAALVQTNFHDSVLLDKVRPPGDSVCQQGNIRSPDQQQLEGHLMVGGSSDDLELHTFCLQYCRSHSLRGSEAMQGLWSSTWLPGHPQR